MRALLLDNEEPGDLTLDTSRDQDRSWLSSSLDARRHVRRFAEHLAVGVYHDRAALDADAGGKLGRARSGVPCVEVGERALDCERRAHGALGIVLLGLRIAEQCHQSVAELFQHMAAQPAHRRRSFVEIGVDEVAPVLRVQLRGEARRADKIAEHDCDRTALGRCLKALRWSRLRRGSGNVRRRTRAGYDGDRVEQPSSIANNRNANVLEVVNRQPRQQVRVDLVVPELLLVLAEPKTAKPPADIHRRASHGLAG